MRLIVDGGVRLVGVVAATSMVGAAAWLCDDAWIYFRVVEQASAGHGLVWNADERVQIFTSPAWMLLLVAARVVGVGLPTAATWLSVIATAAWLGVLSYGARRLEAALLAAAVVVGSKALVEFSSSGLETPLVPLVLVGLVHALDRGRHRAAGLAAGLALFVRLDLAVVVAPLLLLGAPRRAWGWAVPLPAAWCAYALVTYGSPFPNTAPAKLGFVLPLLQRLDRGVFYALVSFRWDPVLLALLPTAVVSGVLARRVDRLIGALALSTTLGVAYVVVVTGDYMGGRFLVPAAITALIALVRTVDARPEVEGPPGLLLAAVALAIGTTSPRHPLRDLGRRDEAAPIERGVHDERTARLASAATLLRGLEDGRVNLPEACRPDAPRVVVAEDIGGAAYIAPREQHVVDVMGLADPLLARIRVRPDDQYQVGHVRRRLPRGYLETLRTGEDHLADPGLSACWRRVRLATRAPLDAPGRPAAIAALTLHGCDDLVAPLDMDCRVDDPRFEPCAVDPALSLRASNDALLRCATATLR